MIHLTVRNMQTKNCRCAILRTLIFMYIIWLTLSLASAVITPPETPPYKQNMDEKMKFTDVGNMNGQTMERFNDINNEDTQISKINLQNIPYPEEQQPHANYQAFPTHMGNYFHYMFHQTKDQPFQGNVQNEAQKTTHNQVKYHAISPLSLQFDHKPDTLKQVLSQPQNNIYNRHLKVPDYNILMKNGYGTYPFVHNWDTKSSTFNLPSVMSPFIIKQSKNHQIDTQLSDEMKRELQNGKIIVLSDSVVSSNFESNAHEKSTKNMSKKPILKVRKINETITEN